MRSIIFVIETPDTYSNSLWRVRYRGVCLVKSIVYTHIYAMLILESLSNPIYKQHILAPNTKRGIG